MPKACDVKRGDIIEYKGAPYIVKQIDVKSPSSRGAATLYKMRLNHAKTGQKVDESFKGDELLGDIDFERRAMSFSYRDGDDYVFMDAEDFSQYSVSETELGDARLYITDNMEGLTGLMVDGQLIGVNVPQSVEMAIIETTPGMKGASASARTKPAEFATGLVIQVPEYIEVGERVKINTEESKFMSRV
jgi:elongation factor P